MEEMQRNEGRSGSGVWQRRILHTALIWCICKQYGKGTDSLYGRNRRANEDAADGISKNNDDAFVAYEATYRKISKPSMRIMIITDTIMIVITVVMVNCHHRHHHHDRHHRSATCLSLSFIPHLSISYLLTSPWVRLLVCPLASHLVGLCKFSSRRPTTQSYHYLRINPGLPTWLGHCTAHFWKHSPLNAQQVPWSPKSVGFRNTQVKSC